MLAVQDRAAGAVVTFEGVVRDHDREHIGALANEANNATRINKSPAGADGGAGSCGCSSSSW